MKDGENIQKIYTRLTTLTNELKSLGRTISEEERVEKILTRVLQVTWESMIIAIQESKNITTLPLDELIENLKAYELRSQTIMMDVPKKERNLDLRITEGSDLEDDEMEMITKDLKKYLRRGKVLQEMEARARPKLQKNVNTEKEQVSKECVILKEKCKNLELRTCETENENNASTNQVQVKEISKIWYMDNGFSKHMTRNKNQFFSLAAFKGGNVSIGRKEKKRKRKESEGIEVDVRGKEEERLVGSTSPTHIGLNDKIWAMVLWSEKSVDEEEIVEVGGSGSGDTTATKGLVRLRKRFQELVPSRKEPLHDLLQKVSDSYNPKKKKSEIVIIPEKAMGVWRQKKQSEANLKKSLAESTKKVVVKGKKKIGETSEETQIEEMDLVLHDEDETEELDVVTPSAKKINTSKKKSSEMSIEAEDSVLSKRTRYAIKSKKVQVVEKESE
ncbi:intracellular protein transport protein USO1-like [Nicotiana sylvestris]|uniref:intracellular protein transport protein USO1-like n=1 Tax=Nicotiana sylvestris TaxID=4096 RepID=UPI00388C7533